MAYNSDGYIMVDFSEVDFRQTNQYIEGLFDRLRKVIGTNKFVLVINANGKTPLPSTVSITNGQYVIESCIFTFSVNSSDRLHIKRNSPDPTALIDDTVISTEKTWSSNKISSELSDKQHTLTAGANITIVDNVISATGGGSSGTVLSGTLEAGETSITFTDDSITSTALIEVFTDDFSSWVTNESVSGSTLTITFVAMATDIQVKVRVS